MEQKRRVVITAIGMISSLGNGKKEFFQNCIAGKNGISECDVFPTAKLRTNYFGVIRDLALPYEPGYVQERLRIEEMSEYAVKELLHEAGDDIDFFGRMGRRVCFCFGTLLGHTLHGLKYARDVQNGQQTPEMLATSYEFIDTIKKMFQIKGGSYVSSAACASGTIAAGMAYELIKNGKYDMAVIGGADPITEFSAYGFHSLKNLSAGICSPFDKKRNGLNIGEGAAFLLAETLESALARDAAIYGEIAGYGVNNDAYHITSPDPEGRGAYLSMHNALSDAGITIDQVQYINAHGTGTIHNDIMEMKVVNRLLEESKNKDHKPYISSLKGQIGHCMGASGAIELAALLLAVKNQVYMPQPQLKEPMEECSKVSIYSESRKLNIQYALSNSFAFAGNTASILIKRH